MNLFRSEEHARAWDRFDPDVTDTLLPVAAWMQRFSGDMFRQRGRTDYITWLTEWRARQQR